MVNYQLWMNSFLSYLSIFVSYITYYHNQVKDIHAFAKSFGWVSGVTMIMNGIFRSIYFFSKNQPVQWSRSVAFLNVVIGVGVIYSVLKKLYITLNVLLYIVGAWLIFESFRIFFVYHNKLKISPASSVLLSNFIFGISILIFNHKFNVIDQS